MDESEETRPAHRKRRRFWSGGFVWLALVAVLVGGTSAAIALNALGENVGGTVACANGPVSGVFIEADRLSRVVATGIEFQSGSADWRATSPNTAAFDYWLPYGGAYAIHFGCDSLQGGSRGAWGSDNRTPFVRGASQQWRCNNPVNTGTTTIVVRDCTKG